MLLLCASLLIFDPGSAMPGHPASDIIPISLPFFTRINDHAAMTCPWVFIELHIAGSSASISVQCPCIYNEKQDIPFGNGDLVIYGNELIVPCPGRGCFGFNMIRHEESTNLN